MVTLCSVRNSCCEKCIQNHIDGEDREFGSIHACPGACPCQGVVGVGSVAGRIAYPVYASVLLHLSPFSKCELSAHLQQHHLSIQCQRKGDFLSSSLTASPPERVALTRKQSNLGPEKNPIFLLSQDQASTKSGPGQEKSSFWACRTVHCHTG